MHAGLTAAILHDMATVPSAEPAKLIEMGIREFLRGGYQHITQPTQLTKFGKVIGVYTPLPNADVAIERTVHGPFYFSTRR